MKAQKRTRPCQPRVEWKVVSVHWSSWRTEQERNAYSPSTATAGKEAAEHHRRRLSLSPYLSNYLTVLMRIKEVVVVLHPAQCSRYSSDSKRAGFVFPLAPQLMLLLPGCMLQSLQRFKKIMTSRCYSRQIKWEFLHLPFENVSYVAKYTVRVEKHFSYYIISRVPFNSEAALLACLEQWFQILVFHVLSQSDFYMFYVCSHNQLFIHIQVVPLLKDTILRYRIDVFFIILYLY